MFANRNLARESVERAAAVRIVSATLQEAKQLPEDERKTQFTAILRRRVVAEAVAYQERLNTELEAFARQALAALEAREAV